MSKSKIICDNKDCRKEFERLNSEINRSKRIGRKQYCSPSCWGKSDRNVGLSYVSKDILKENQDKIKEYANNKRDIYTPFRYFIKVCNIKDRKKEVNIDVDYLVHIWQKQNGICPITGEELLLPNNTDGWKSKDHVFRASLDRINPKLGYIKGNVRFIAWTANIARNRISDEELIEFCRVVVKNNPN